MPEAHPVDNRVAVLVLQHPQEQDRVLGTAKLLCSTLANAKLTIGLSWRNLGHALGAPAEPKDWGVLYLGSAHAAQEKGPLVALDRKGEPLADQAAPLRGRARRSVALRPSAPRGAARRGLDLGGGRNSIVRARRRRCGAG